MSTILRRLKATTPMSRITLPARCTTLRNICMRSNKARPILIISRLPSSSRPNADTQGSHTSKAEDSPYTPFSFAGLGATRAVKITILISIGIIGTAETVFWTKALWHYFSEPTDAQPEEGENVHH
ncbi:hypothetical protein EDD37DRAFT_82155 [Exophiala viscosa]|uniref:uncharacterized protein n=1 Tax=Exophiala viscosa TaxID=2486360 RepID=UPI00218FFFB2|nr:hypothetical protein EDD37DRAFT_82155 [Exophiala viscosa]